MKYDWKPWTGGKCPLRRGGIVETFWSDGQKLPPFECGGLVWSHDQGDPKLIAYRTWTKLELSRAGYVE